MIRYSVNTPYGKVTVSLPASDPNGYAKLQYTGEQRAVAFVREWLEKERGAFGHIIGDETTPIDLQTAMNNTDPDLVPVEMLEGADVLKKYVPGIPKNAKDGVAIIIDYEFEYPPYSIVCSLCKNVSKKNRTCKAFLNGIPDVIWLGENNHTQPFPGDGGIRFERIS